MLAYIADARVRGAKVVVVALGDGGAAIRNSRVPAYIGCAGVRRADVVVVAISGGDAAVRDRRVAASACCRIACVGCADVVVIATGGSIAARIYHGSRSNVEVGIHGCERPINHGRSGDAVAIHVS